MPARLVLASASPARLRTLRAAGFQPDVIVSAVDEESLAARHPDAAPDELALLLARAKADDVARSSGSGALVLGCDSILDLDGESLGKPGSPEVAVERWRAMRGRTGVLRTGHWLVDARESADRPSVGATASTTVHFAYLSDAEIAAYVATGEPLQVAGGFTVDGIGGAFIDGIDGDYHNVVGVSLPLVRRLLADLGLSVADLWQAPAARD